MTATAAPVRAAPVAAVLTAMTLVVLDAGMTNLALPTLGATLGVSPAEAVVVVTAYQTALLAALLPCAAIGGRLGYRRVFAWGAALFTLGAGLAALSDTLAWLVAARVVQGLGGAAIMALGVPLLRFTVPPGRLGAAIGWNALTVALASSAGPVVGALLISRAGWPWIYAVDIPLGIAVLAAVRWLPRTPAGAEPVDLAAIGLTAAMFAGLAAAIQVWPSHPVAGAGLAALGLICLERLVRRERSKPAPVFPLDLLRRAGFRGSVLASVLCFAGQTAAMIALPFHLMGERGRTTGDTGLFMMAWPVSVAVMATVAGRLSDRFPTAWLCALGASGLALGLAGASLWPGAAGPLSLLPLIALCGLGFGLFQTPNNRNMFLCAPLERSAASGGAQGTARLTGQTAGAVLMGAVFTLAPQAAAPRLGLGLAAVLTLAAGLVSLSRARTPDFVPAATGE